MKTYMAIIAAITILATTAALGQGGAATPTGVDKITAYGAPANAETQANWAVQYAIAQTSATVSAPVVLTDRRGGAGMHRGGSSFHGKSFQGNKSFHGGSFHGKSFHGKPFHGGFHRDSGFQGRKDFHHRFQNRHNDFNLRLRFGSPHSYGYYPYQYSYPYRYYPYGYYPYGYYYGNPGYSYPYFSFSW